MIRQTWIERVWSGRFGLYLLLLPFSLLYGLVVYIRRKAYQAGWLTSWQAPVPVVIVGNLTAGGNGKTPVVIWLVKQLTAEGLRVGVVSRGYGGKSAHYPVMVNEKTAAEQAGDEPVLIFQRTQVPVAVAPKRAEAIRALLNQYTLDVIITDDGLQHYALCRAVEIVVIDGVRRFGNGWWLPAGPMRERATRLVSVDAIIVNGGEAKSNEISMQLQHGLAVNLCSGEQRALTEFSHVVAMAGIGNPPRFFQMLQQQDVAPEACIAFADHQPYTPSLLCGLTRGKQVLLMTEKDAVKCASFAQPHWWYLPVDAVLQQAAAKALIDKIKALSMGELHASD